MKCVHVAVAVIENDSGEVLIARRAGHQHMGGLWEFPGGKVEAGETVLQALQREIREETGLAVHSAVPLLRIPFQYPDKHVLLDVWQVTGFTGTPAGCEGQPVCWTSRNRLSGYAFPPANRAILTALRMPDRLLVTGDFADPRQCLQRVDTAIRMHGIRAVMLRAHAMPAAGYAALAAQLLLLCRQHAAALILNTAPGQMLPDADGLHLSAQRLLTCRERPVPASMLLGASCHDQAEVVHAVALGVDYITLSPVLPTRSHPDTPALGWDGFARVLQDCPLPVFAMGGLDGSALPAVKAHGGFGVAAISAWWTD